MGKWSVLSIVIVLALKPFQISEEYLLMDIFVHNAQQVSLSNFLSLLIFRLTLLQLLEFPNNQAQKITFKISARVQALQRGKTPVLLLFSYIFFLQSWLSRKTLSPMVASVICCYKK